MKKIYLVRHGQTNSNVGNLVQDGTTPLSEIGLKQAEVLAQRLKHLSFSHLFVSDYIRTRQIVEPLLKDIEIVPVYTPLIRESKRPTQFVGQSNRSDEFKAYAKLADENINNPDWHFADEENFHDVLNRTKNFFEHILTLDGDIMVITHGRFITYAVMHVILGESLTPENWLACMHSFATTNTGITVIKFDEEHKRLVLETYNDKAHFAE